MGDEGVQRDFALLRLVHVARQLGAALDAAEGRAAPDAAGDQLERTGADFLAGTGHADDHALAPALVCAFQRGAHQLHVADALEAVVDATVGHFDDHFLDRLVVILRVNEISCAQFTGYIELGRVDVDGNDAAGLGHLRTDDRRQTDAAEAEHRHGGALFHLGGVEHGADAGGDAAAEQADLLQRRFLGDHRQGDFRQHGVFGEGRAAHVVVDRLAVVAEARGAVGHQALALGGAHRAAQVGLAGFAEFALAAFGGVQRDHVVADLDRGHALAHRLDDAAAFVAEDRREHALGVGAGQGVGIGMAHAGGDDAHQHFTGLGRRHVHFDDLQRLVGGKGHGGTGLDHGRSPEDEKWQKCRPRRFSG